MSVTDFSIEDHAAILAEVDRVTRSNILRGSDALCRLLRYFAQHSLSSSGVPIKEYQLATEVFGRPADFDPRMDSTVRVQTGRLRSKLNEYYSTEGADNPIILEIPKGSYLLAYRKRPVPEPVIATVAQPVPAANANGRPAEAATEPDRRTRQLVRVFAALAGTLLVLVVVESYRYAALRKATRDSSPSPGIQAFWLPFTQSPDPPWLVFSNAEFVGKPQTSMRYFDVTQDSRAGILDHYTGVGEVASVAELIRVFGKLHRGVRIKRGRLLSLDDVKNNDVIFIGSPAENLVLRDIPTNSDFVFHRIEDGDRKGDEEVLNLHPRQGEQKSFRASETLPILEDYAVVSLLPGLNPARWMLVLAGTTTMGTQAASEFVCRERDVQVLLNRLPGRGNPPTPFEAVFRVRITGGVPVSSDLVAFRP